LRPVIAGTTDDNSVIKAAIDVKPHDKHVVRSEFSCVPSDNDLVVPGLDRHSLNTILSSTIHNAAPIAIKSRVQPAIRVKAQEQRIVSAKEIRVASHHKPAVCLHRNGLSVVFRSRFIINASSVVIEGRIRAPVHIKAQHENIRVAKKIRVSDNDDLSVWLHRDGEPAIFRYRTHKHPSPIAIESWIEISRRGMGAARWRRQGDSHEENNDRQHLPWQGEQA
jgi:hypothetical protein